MNKYELRVGNLIELLTTGMQINLPTGKYAEIEEIRAEKVKLRYDYETSNNHCFFMRKYNTIKSIKITSEVLILLGFKYHENLDYFVKNWGQNGMFIIVFRNSNYYIQFNKERYKQIEFIHQLQNIFYEFSNGEQLKFIK
jgi:hypothetical protein